MKTMCPPGYHHNGFVATHALGHICRMPLFFFFELRFFFVLENLASLLEKLAIAIDFFLIKRMLG